MAGSEEFNCWNQLCKECIEWLDKCEVLSRINENQSNDEFLAESLRDGKLLCELLEFLDPRAPIEYHEIEQGPSCSSPNSNNLKNIANFLFKCKSNFGLCNSDLIDPQVWYDFSNPEKVLSTLSKLSRSQRARTNHPNIEGFIVQRDLYDSIVYFNSDDYETYRYNSLLNFDDVYQSIDNFSPVDHSDNLNFNVLNDKIVHENKTSFPVESILNQEYLKEYSEYCDLGPKYGETVNQTDNIRTRGINRYYSTESIYYEDLESIYEHIYKPIETNVKNENTKTSKTKREHAIEELVMQERINVGSIGHLIEKFLVPLRPLLRGTTETIFPKIMEIQRLHSDLLVNIEKATNPLCIKKLCEVFTNFRDQFLVYSEYCCKISEALDKLRKLCESDDKIEEMVSKCQESHNGIQLQEALLYPSLKFMKYHLMFENLMKGCSSDDGERVEVEKIMEMMRDINFFINDTKKDYDDLVICRKVINNINNLRATKDSDFGRLLLDGEFYQISRVDQQLHRRYGFVFEKILIVTIPDNISNTSFTFRSSKNLARSQFKVENSNNESQLRDMRFRYPLNLITHLNSRKDEVFTLYLKNEKCREEWVEAFEKATEVLNPKIDRRLIHKFNLFTCERPQCCDKCSKFLGGLFHQGYHCNICGIIVHKKCIESSGQCFIVRPEPSSYEFLLNRIWFVGSMKRDMAEQQLRERTCGTFLVRYRLQALQNNETPFAVSLITHMGIRHLIIYKRTIDGDNVFYLRSERYFKLIADLISYYENHDLKEDFKESPVIPRNAFLLYPLQTSMKHD